MSEEGFSRLHVFRYSIRPGTPAERLKGHVDPRVKSEHTRALVKLDRELRNRYARCFLNRPLRVLIEADGAGYTERYVRVRSLTSHPEGSFQQITPVQMTPEALLLEDSAVAIGAVSR